MGSGHLRCGLLTQLVEAGLRSSPALTPPNTAHSPNFLTRLADTLETAPGQYDRPRRLSPAATAVESAHENRGCGGRLVTMKRPCVPTCRRIGGGCGR